MSAPSKANALRYLRVTKTLRPQQPGTLKLLRQYGNALLCVRYREDGRGRRRYTTVELVIDEGPVQRRYPDRTIVQVRMPLGDNELRARAMKLGAWWDAPTRTWHMSMKLARSLGLQAQVRRQAPRMVRHAQVE